jgi:NAD+ kinase
MTRRVLLVVHTGRPEAVCSAHDVTALLTKAGLEVAVLQTEAAELQLTDPHVVTEHPVAGAEVVIVLGGDGTVLRAAELVREVGTPLVGANLGHVGFLAEADPEALTAMVDRVVTRRYEVEERMTVDVTVRRNGEVLWEGWALNEATVEKTARERMIEVVVEVDGRPLSRFGCDGVVLGTPTGSTAYAFSAGGPVVWPQVEALLLVPISAHALFAKPLVVAPTSLLAVELVAGTPSGVVWCDGRRGIEVPAGARVEVRRSAVPVRFARLHPLPFTDRLVAKFGLPVHGWRGRATPAG